MKIAYLCGNIFSHIF